MRKRSFVRWLPIGVILTCPGWNSIPVLISRDKVSPLRRPWTNRLNSPCRKNGNPPFNRSSKPFARRPVPSSISAHTPSTFSSGKNSPDNSWRSSVRRAADFERRWNARESNSPWPSEWMSKERGRTKGLLVFSGGDRLNHSSSKDEEDEEETDLTCAQWLEDMGLPASTNEPRRPSVVKKSSKKETLRSTTIVITDLSSLNSLFNFLLNKAQRLCISLTGSLTGVPPSLLSPRPFLHSTLRYLNVHWQSNTMLTIDGGPLLPDRLQQLWTLFAEKTGRAVQLNCAHLERSSAFNYDGQVSRTLKEMRVDGENGELRAQFADLLE